MDKVYSSDRDRGVTIEDEKGKEITLPGTITEVEAGPGGVIAKSEKYSFWGNKVVHVTTLPAGAKVKVEK